ncbi:looped-hinge helix DNA binding domain-containing protein, AbrB family [Desulfotomaculum arcticum]|uniref:Looped-hinge helix DNA binding domain-containing protein, AbrB family n=1 Tax=Desulfotruncus arcticus DSM 17038 TaxID=1121424 RepID=A0A1I2ZYF0_9FIRM|nr:AbrB/MazE/SpoVT family DNA-binding domain-containing protein [Desulfotruncus arcticus]SFH42700.1 looped-hinge helix DNA binding domain-containing protein, AbrB family [Desulfotomaculum arcticum] [Desulfotruncus arcticus DSM 17038]
MKEKLESRLPITQLITHNMAKITSKGQVTIPKFVREALKISEGDEIVFELQGDKVNIRRMTAIDTLAATIGPKLRKEFPTPEELEKYLKNNRHELFGRIYGSDKSSD